MSIAMAEWLGDARRVPSRSLLAACALVALLVAVGAVAASGTTFRVALVASMLVLVVGVWSVRPAALLPLLVVWTVGLGILRRVVSYKIVGATTGTDPLLLVEPLIFVLAAAAAVRRGALRAQTLLGRSVALLCVLVALAALNPMQGSAFAGFAALLFFAPILMFWVGRVLVNDRGLRGVLSLVALLALPSVGYGFAQLFFGFPSWDVAWVANQGYSALSVGGVTRQFASFSSASEYGYFIAIGAILWIFLRPYRVARIVAIACGGLLVVGVFYESMRGVIFLLVVAMALVGAAHRGASLRIAAIAAAVGVLLIPQIAGALASPSTTRAKGTAALVSHQVNGLADPTGSQSTLNLHYTIFINGLRGALTKPLGIGLSAVNIAGAKFSGTEQGTEEDPSNAAVAMGLPGLAVYILLIASAFASAYRVARDRRDPLALAALGLLAVTFMQWMTGGQYAVSYLIWLVLGWVDARAYAASEATAASGSSAR